MENLYILYGFIFFTLILNLVNFVSTHKRLFKKEAFLYVYLLVSILGWFFCNALADSIKEPNVAIFFARIAILFPLNILNAIFQITTVFPQSIISIFRPSFLKFLNFLVLVFTIFFAIFSQTHFNIAEFVIIADGPMDFEPGLFYLIVFLFVIFFTGMIYLSWLRNFDNYTKTQKGQVVVFLIAFTISCLSSLFGLVFLPLQGLSEYTPTLFLSLSLMLFVTNQNLLIKGFMPNVVYDLGVAIWGVLASGVSTSFVLLLTRYQGDLTYLSIFLLTFTLIFVLLASYKRVVTILRKDYHSIEDEVLKFASRTTVILDKEKIIQELYYTLGIIFPQTNCKIILEGKNGSSLFTKLKKWWSSFENPSITTQEPLIEQFLLKKVDEIATKSLYDIFREKNIELVIPLNIGDRLGGMIVMKNLTRVLGIKEHEILNLLAENASLAISRAILHEEVEEYSKSLESKVSEQTQELRLRMESMEEMRQREKDLLDIMGHELRTPLTIARNSLELIDMHKAKQRKKRKRIKWDSNLQKQFDYVKAAIRREMGIVETLLSATKLDAKKMETHIVDVDLSKVVDTTLLGFEKEAVNKGLKVKVELNRKKNWVVKADSLQIQQVLDNLVSNAVKYTHKGFVKISLKDLDKKVSLVISDSGEGMTKESIKKLGTKFFRLNQHIPTNGDRGSERGIVRPGGTGLGLYVAFGLVDLMGGTYKVESELGKGSTFTVVFKKA